MVLGRLLAFGAILFCRLLFISLYSRNIKFLQSVKLLSMLQLDTSHDLHSSKIIHNYSHRDLSLANHEPENLIMHLEQKLYSHHHITNHQCEATVLFAHVSSTARHPGVKEVSR